ncbi:MAG: type II secretion system F family protein, partial [Candidatus Eremiobacterota bacterium]
ASNIPPEESLYIAAKSTGNKFISHKIEENILVTGGNIDLSLAMTDLFPPMIYHIIDIEQENNKLAETFYKISNDYKTELEFKIAKLLPLIETILIIGMALAIGGVVISIFMPMYHG